MKRIFIAFIVFCLFLKPEEQVKVNEVQAIVKMETVLPIESAPVKPQLEPIALQSIVPISSNIAITQTGIDLQNKLTQKDSIENAIQKIKNEWPKYEEKINSDWQKIKDAYKDLEKYFESIMQNEKHILLGSQIIEQLEQLVSKGKSDIDEIEISRIKKFISFAKSTNDHAIAYINNTKRYLEKYAEKMKYFEEKIQNIKQDSGKRGKVALENSIDFFSIDTVE